MSYSANFLSWHCHPIYQNKLGLVIDLLKTKVKLMLLYVSLIKVIIRQWMRYVCIYTCVCIYECTQHLCLCVLWIDTYIKVCVCVRFQIKSHVYYPVIISHAIVVVFSCFHKSFWLALVINFNRYVKVKICENDPF